MTEGRAQQPMVEWIGRFVNGYGQAARAIRALFEYPKLIAPMMACWLLMGVLFLTLASLPALGDLSDSPVILLAFGVLFALALSVTIASSVSLELIQHIESGSSPDLGRALLDSIGKNLLRALPIVFIWSLLWYCVLFLEFLLGEDDDPVSAESAIEQATRVFDGELRHLRLSRASLRALNKVIRMTVFLILPAIAWEEVGPFEASKRGLKAAQSHPVEFTARAVSSELILTIVLVPMVLGYSLVAELGIDLPLELFKLGIVYLALVWSFTFYLEQIFAAELYLWHRRWLSQRRRQQVRGDAISKLIDVPMPSLLDGFPEFGQHGTS